MTLKCLLKQQNKTQQNIAECLKCTQQVISKWCLGKSTPSLEIMQKLAKALDVDLQTIVNCFVEDKKEKDQ